MFQGHHVSLRKACLLEETGFDRRIKWILMVDISQTFFPILHLKFSDKITRQCLAKKLMKYLIDVVGMHIFQCIKSI